MRVEVISEDVFKAVDNGCLLSATRSGSDVAGGPFGSVWRGAWQARQEVCTLGTQRFFSKEDETSSPRRGRLILLK